jgi:hypothetical protein
MSQIPVRLQLFRAKGFNLQLLSTTTNGLAATLVTRPGRWGNPYVEGTAGAPDAATAVARFRTLMMAKTSADRRLLAELASLKEIGRGAGHDPILTHHSERLKSLGLAYNLLGELRITTAGQIMLRAI